MDRQPPGDRIAVTCLNADSTALSSGPASTTKPNGCRTTCGDCTLRHLCLALCLDVDELTSFADLVGNWRVVHHREALFRRGDHLRSLYVLRTGSIKTVVSGPDGSEHVSGFRIAGEILGLDAIVHGEHACDAVALEYSTVCVIPFLALETLCGKLAHLQQHFHRVLSAEIVRGTTWAMVLAAMKAEQRVAAFLLDISKRLQQRGYSHRNLTLRMSREDIGNHLGMRLETVSRTLSQFQQEGLLRVNDRHIVLTDLERLRTMSALHAGAPSLQMAPANGPVAALTPTVAFSGSRFCAAGLTALSAA